MLYLLCTTKKLAMNNFTHYVCIVVLFCVSLSVSAQEFFPEQQKLKEQQYVLKEIKQSTDPFILKMNPTDEILFSEDFADSLLGNNDFGPWTREGQHGLIWLWDFDGPDGPLIVEAEELLSTTSSNGFLIFDADAADPLSMGIDRTGYLVSPVMDFTDANSCIVQFQQFFNYCCYNFSPLFLGVSNDGGDTWVDLDAIPGFTLGSNNFSQNPMLTNIDISPYASGFSEVKIRFGFNPEEFEGFTHYFWAIDDIVIFVNPIEFDVTVNDMYLTNILEDYEYLRIPEAQANDQKFTVIVTNNGGQDQTGVYAEMTVFDPLGSPTTYYSDTVDLSPGLRDTLYLFTSLVPDELGLYNCNVNVFSDQDIDDEFPDNNIMSKSFNTNTHIMAHEHGTFFDGSDGSRMDQDNPGNFKEFALGSMFKMQASAVLDGIQAQIVDSSSVGKVVYPVIYRIVSGGIQGNVEAVEGYSTDALLDGYTITVEDLLGDVFNIALSNEVTLDPNEFYMIALFSEENSQEVYYKTIVDFDTDLSTIRFGLDQFGNDNWFNAYNFTPAIRLNFNISLGIDDMDVNLSEVLAYPNPATEYIAIDFTTRSGEYVTLRVYDMTGKLIIDKALGNLPTGDQHLRINLNGVNSGLYFYELQQGNSLITDKFIVK